MAEDMHDPIKWSSDNQFVEMIESLVEQIRTFHEDIRPKTSIYNVPLKLAIRDINSPHFVSIGPIHGGRADLLAMEEMKLWYSMFFFYRSRDPAKTFQECGEAIINLNKQAREYYAHDLRDCNEYELMKILLVDGCFLLELFFRHSDAKEYTYLKENNIEKYGEMKTTDDLILGNPWMRRAVCQDIALLDNQIPLIVLETLFSKIKPFLKNENCVKNYTLCFFTSDLNSCNTISISMNEEEPRKVEEEPRHILEMLHKGLRPSWTLQNGEKKYGLMYGATKLMESGINIKKNFDLSNETDNFNSHLFEIKFDSRKGILKVPQFWMRGTTSLIIRNLIAFEQCSFGLSHSHHVTSYVMFMKSLIRSERDVNLLKQKGIIKKHPGSGSDVNILDFFNACCEGVAPKDFYYSKVCEEVEEYGNNWMHIHSYMTCVQGRGRRYRTVLAGQYCPDACRTIAFFAATVLLLLTCLQTFYTIYPYYH